jgi:tripartite-type tricarboxylate transporter receptor subunit TctC
MIDLKTRRALLSSGAALSAGTLLAAGWCRESIAQAKKTWPERPVKLVLGYPTGGAADAVARPMQNKIEAAIGQPLIFEYKPGAGATIGADFTAKSAPDGYTIHYADSGPLTILPNGKKLSYDPVKSFSPIGIACSGGTALVAHPSVSANNLEELLRLIRAKPGGMTYGTSGIGGAGHLAGELFQSMTKTDMVHVPYKGGGPAMVELLGGQVPLLFASMPTAVPHIKSGKIKVLGVTSATRSSALPQAPTIAEQGLSGFEAAIWWGLLGPAGMPADIVQKLNAAMNAALSDAAVAEKIRSQGYEPMTSTPAECAARIVADLAKWGKVIRDAKITFEG